MGVWGTVAATSAEAVASPAGTYNFTDSFGDTNIPLTINGDGTWKFGGCTGQWLAYGPTISLHLASPCDDILLMGHISAKSIGKATKPGPVQVGNNTSTGTWYALRCGANTKVTCSP